MAKKKPSKKSPKKSVKSKVESDFQKRKKKAEALIAKQLLQDTEKYGTIHDIKNELLLFYKYEDKSRKNKEELKLWEKRKKAVQQYNSIVRKTREKLEYETRKGKNVKSNMEIIQGKKPIDLHLSKSLVETLGAYKKQFKYKENKLVEIPYLEINSKINYFSGKEFNFIIDTGFKRHSVSSKDIKKETVLSEKDITMYFLSIFKKDFQEAVEKSSKEKLTPKERKQRNKVFDKINNVIQHNENIASLGTYKKKLIRYDRKGNVIKEEGQYPISIRIYDNVIKIEIGSA